MLSKSKISDPGQGWIYSLIKCGQLYKLDWINPYLIMNNKNKINVNLMGKLGDNF